MGSKEKSGSYVLKEVAVMDGRHDVIATYSRDHEESGCNKLVVYVCLNAVLVEFILTRGIYG